MQCDNATRPTPRAVTGTPDDRWVVVSIVRVAIELGGPDGAGRGRRGAAAHVGASSPSPRACGAIANAHEEVPVTLPDFERSPQRSYVYDAAGQRDRQVRGGEQPADRARRRAAARDRRVPRRRGPRVLRAPRRQRPQPRARQLSNFAGRRPGAGCLDDHACRSSRTTTSAGFERDGRYKLLQVTLRGPAGEAEDQGRRSSSATSTRSSSGNNAYGIAGRGRGRTSASRSPDLDAHRGGVPRRARQVALELRPDQPPERSRRPVPPGARAARGGGAAQPSSRSDDRRARLVVLPEQREAPPGACRPSRTYYTEALRDYLLNRSRPARRHRRGALQRRCTAAA